MKENFKSRIAKTIYSQSQQTKVLECASGKADAIQSLRGSRTKTDFYDHPSQGSMEPACGDARRSPTRRQSANSFPEVDFLAMEIEGIFVV